MRTYKETEKVVKEKHFEVFCDKCGERSYNPNSSSVIDWEYRNFTQERDEIIGGVELATNCIWMEQSGQYFEVILCPKCFWKVLSPYINRVEQ